MNPLHYHLFLFFFFFFNDTATTEIYTLSLHDALPISPRLCPWPSACRSVLSPSSWADRKSTRLNSSHLVISYAVFCLKKKKSRKFFGRAEKTELSQRRPRITGQKTSRSCHRSLQIVSCYGLHDSFLRNLSLCQFIHFSTISQNHYPLALANDFFQLRADKQHGEAFLTQRLDQFLNFGLCSDIDSTGRLIENK